MGSENRVDTSSREIAATSEAVWAAFADPAAWAKWIPPSGMTGILNEFDFRQGGIYKLTLYYGDGSGAGKTKANEDVSEGTFVEIVPNQRVVQRIVFESDNPAFAGEMLMTWLLEPGNDGTLVTITAEDVPLGISAEDHVVGLQSTLENLAMLVEKD